MRLKYKSLVHQFLAHVRKTNGCWLWQAFIHPSGYGMLHIGGKYGKVVAAHRLSWELFVGKIPSDKQLDHLCRVRHCVNPKHLEPVTQLVNALRGEHPWIVQGRIKRNSGKCKYGHVLAEVGVWSNGHCAACGRGYYHSRKTKKTRAYRRTKLL